MDETSRTGGASAEAIQEHYDVGNAFYRLWLDDSLTYSCALFEEGDSLEMAQRRKLEHHVRESGAETARRVLDIGCGWGSLLRHLVERAGVEHAVGLTLSEAQAKHVDALNLPGVQVRLESWTDHRPEAPYDAIVSVGALEHFVRPETSTAERVRIYRSFFERCRELLRPGGRLSLQTMAYGIGRFTKGALASIFPESDLPRLAEIAEALERSFEIVRLRNDPDHYATTVREWHRRLVAQRQEACELIGEERTTLYERFLEAGARGYDARVFELLRLTLKRRDLG